MLSCPFLKLHLMENEDVYLIDENVDREWGQESCFRICLKIMMTMPDYGSSSVVSYWMLCVHQYKNQFLLTGALRNFWDTNTSGGRSEQHGPDHALWLGEGTKCWLPAHLLFLSLPCLRFCLLAFLAATSLSFGNIHHTSYLHISTALSQPLTSIKFRVTLCHVRYSKT